MINFIVLTYKLSFLWSRIFEKSCIDFGRKKIKVYIFTPFLECESKGIIQEAWDIITQIHIIKIASPAC